MKLLPVVGSAEAETVVVMVCRLEGIEGKAKFGLPRLAGYTGPRGNGSWDGREERERETT